MRAVLQRRLGAVLAAVLVPVGAGAGQGAGAPAPAAPVPQREAAAPLRQYTDARGRLCRVYERHIVVDGETRNALATVCRESDGRWVLSR